MIPADQERDDLIRPVVPFVPFRCPWCGRGKPFTYRVDGRRRYHECKVCRRKYRSLELSSEAIEVKDWSMDPNQ